MSDLVGNPEDRFSRGSYACKLVFMVSDKLRHKLACTAIEEGLKHPISDIEEEEFVN